jgi:hypothetical protein
MLCPQLCMGIPPGARFPAQLMLCPQLCMGISPRRYTEIGQLHWMMWRTIFGRPWGVVFGGAGEPLLRLDTIAETIELVRQQRHGVPFRAGAYTRPLLIST